jgi:hypothetical protein
LKEFERCRERERERARGRKKRVRRGSMKNQEGIEILGDKLKLLLGFLLVEVRGLVFIHNLLYNLFFLRKPISAYL